MYRRLPELKLAIDKVVADYVETHGIDPTSPDYQEVWEQVKNHGDTKGMQYKRRYGWSTSARKRECEVLNLMMAGEPVPPELVAKLREHYSFRSAKFTSDEEFLANVTRVAFRLDGPIDDGPVAWRGG